MWQELESKGKGDFGRKRRARGARRRREENACKDKQGRYPPVPSFQKLDSAIQQINHYSVDTYYGNQFHYPLDRDLSPG